MTPAHSEEESHPQDSDTEVEELESPSSPYTPDLSTISSGGLRKLTENVVAAIEGHDGSLYHPLYRQLQVKPAKYYDFNNGVVRHIRNKHFVDIKRGSDASIKSISGLVLRGFGHEVWRAGSDWLLEDKDLDEGEVRIVYDRRKLEDPDPRFYNILPTLFRQMRNVMFSPRSQPSRRGRPANTTPSIITDDSYMGDVDTSRAPSPHARARATATKKVENLAAQVAKRLRPPVSRMSVDQTEEAIVDLITRLAEIRQNSNPKTFEQLWQAHIMRADELEEEGATPTATIPPPPRNDQSTSPSNEPFNTTGILPFHAFASSLPLPPSLPTLMSTYISTAPFSPSKTHTAAAPLTQSYHWPSAPVEDHAFVKFFIGVTYRIDVAPSSILG